MAIFRTRLRVLRWFRNRASVRCAVLASSPVDRTVDFGSLGPVGRSTTDARFFQLATVFGLIPYRFESALRLS
jgi:hypothetical protein